MTAYFVTGTDTGVGKTLVSGALLAAARRRGLRCAGLKPVAAGGLPVRGGVENEDATLLRGLAAMPLEYAEVNPVALRLAAAPHLAAEAEGRTLHVAPLVDHVARVREAHGIDFLLVEGAGGFLVPLNDRETLADLAAALGFPVILVVGLRLGCLNHALLTAAAIRAAGLPLAGWIGSSPGPDMDLLAGNLASLEARLPGPCLGVLPWLGPRPDVAQAAEALFAGAAGGRFPWPVVAP